MALTDFYVQQKRCSSCAACRFVIFDKLKSLRFGGNCPAFERYKYISYSARGRFQLGQTLLDGDCDYTPGYVDVIHSCMSCGSCDINCKICRYNLDVIDHNIELKNDVVLKGKLFPKQAELLDSLKSEKTLVIGAKNANRAKWADGLGLKDLSKEKAEVAFFPGCKFSFDSNLQQSAKNAASLLKKLGVDVGYMGAADACCGSRAYQMGFYDEFGVGADANIKAFEAAGVKTIVTPCSDCYHGFKRLYAARGLKVEVLHVVECLDKLIAEGKLTFSKKLDMTVTYHDPCHLGRLGEPYVPWNGKEKKILFQVHTWDPPKPRYNGIYGIYDAPRNVINAIPGVKLVEMERIREYSWCCGAGANINVTKPEFSEWTASERITEANATSADALITACPWCESNFANATDENGKSIKVLDIVDLVMQAL